MDENIYYREFIHPSIEVNKHCCSVGSQQKIPLGSWLMFVISVVGFVHWIQTELKGQGQIAFHIDIYLERLFHHVNSTFDL